MATNRGSFSIEFIRCNQDSLIPIVTILTIGHFLIQCFKCRNGDGNDGLKEGVGGRRGRRPSCEG